MRTRLFKTDWSSLVGRIRVLLVIVDMLIGSIIAGACCVQGVTNRARPWSCCLVFIDLRHLDGTVQELLRHAVDWERIHGGLVQRYLGEDRVDAGTLSSELLVGIALNGQHLALVHVTRVLTKDHHKAVLQMRGSRR